jgi:hypothetical protein
MDRSEFRGRQGEQRAEDQWRLSWCALYTQLGVTPIAAHSSDAVRSFGGPNDLTLEPCSPIWDEMVSIRSASQSWVPQRRHHGFLPIFGQIQGI